MNMATIDVHGILERTGADAEAPEGSQAWALAQVDAAVASLVKTNKGLCRAYVNLLEAARCRILDLGGECDPVDVMEHGDVNLLNARTALACIEGAA